MDNQPQAAPGMEKGMGPMCHCPHHKIVPGLIILIGLSFLATGLGWLTYGANNIIWPILLILIGCNKMMAFKCKCYMKHNCCRMDMKGMGGMHDMK